MGLNANITELLTSKTALLSAGIGAAGAIVGKATQEWAKIMLNWPSKTR